MIAALQKPDYEFCGTPSILASHHRSQIKTQGRHELNDQSQRTTMIASTHPFNYSDNAFAPGAGFLAKYSLILPTAIASLAQTNAITLLDAAFEPGSFDVVCGRGKGSYNRPGNKFFRALVVTFIPQYLSARSKVDKSAVLNSIIDKVRSFTNPDTGLPAQFVKHSKNTGWIKIGDEHAREKVGHAIREAIAAKESTPGKDQEKATAFTKQRDLLSQQKMLFASMRRHRPSLTKDMQAAVDSVIGI